MINLEEMVSFEAVDKFTNEVIYESLYLRDVVDFIGEDYNLYINQKVTSGFGHDVEEKDNAIMAGIR